MAEEKKGIVTEFKEFILRGNVVDLAVAVVIGAAFTAVVTSLVTNIFTPLIAAIFGKPDFSDLSFTINNSTFTYGALHQLADQLPAHRPRRLLLRGEADELPPRAPPQGPRRRGERRAPVPGLPELDPQGRHPVRVLHLRGPARRRLTGT